MRYILLISVFLGLAVLAGMQLVSPPPAKPLSYGEAQVGGDFSLIDHESQPFTQEQLKGRFALVYFGFTHCPDICPTGLMTITHALEALGKDAQAIQPVFISVDPERDTPKALSEYLQNFHPSFIGLSGSDEQVKQTAAAFKVYYSKVEQPGSALGYLVDHSGYIFLMGPDGKYLAHFPHNVAEQTLTATLRKLMSK